MTLYKLDETGEAIQAELEEWVQWQKGVRDADLTLARHDIVESRAIGTLAIDVLKHPYHSGKVLCTVVTKLKKNTDSIYDYPWETGVVGNGPEYKSNSREQALQAHQTLVGIMRKQHGCRFMA